MTDGSRSGVLLITGEPVAERMAGPAIRALELGRALARDGRCGPVSLASLAAVDRRDQQVDLTVALDEAALRRLVAAAAVVVIQGDVLGLHPWLADEPVPIVVDAYDPYHLEQLEQARPLGETERRAVVRDCVRSLNTQLARADLVLLCLGAAACAVARAPGGAGQGQPAHLRRSAGHVTARGRGALRRLGGGAPATGS